MRELVNVETFFKVMQDKSHREVKNEHHIFKDHF